MLDSHWNRCGYKDDRRNHRRETPVEEGPVVLRSHRAAVPLDQSERTSIGCFKLVMKSWRQMTR